MKSLIFSAVIALSASTAFADCEVAAVNAQAQYGIPDNLLLGVVRAESSSHPWTTNFKGQGAFHDSKSAAEAYVTSLLDAGSRSVDVGCAQVNLRWHPEAFDSLDRALDPVENIDYAARHLTELVDRLGSWQAAVGAYHNPSQPVRAAAYSERVHRLAGPNARSSSVRITTQRQPPAPDLTHQAPGIHRTSAIKGAIGNIAPADS